MCSLVPQPTCCWKSDRDPVYILCACRSYDERKDMYEAGVDLIRPKMLENVWQVIRGTKS